jgi:hypothetical protein
MGKSQNANNAPRRRPNENFLITTIPPSPSGRRLSHLFFVQSGRDDHGGRWFDAGLQYERKRPFERPPRGRER